MYKVIKEMNGDQTVVFSSSILEHCVNALAELVENNRENNVRYLIK